MYEVKHFFCVRFCLSYLESKKNEPNILNPALKQLNFNFSYIVIISWYRLMPYYVRISNICI